jgi:hypothetical protein
VPTLAASTLKPLVVKRDTDWVVRLSAGTTDN